MSPYLARVASAPMDQLRFRDFMSLKSGYDKFSRLKHNALISLVDNEVVEKVTEECQGDIATIDKTIRWILRGLPLDKAIRKVKTDLEVAENAIKAM